MDVDEGDPARRREAEQDLVVAPDPCGLLHRVAVGRALRSDGVIGGRDGDDPGRREHAEELVEDDAGIPRVRRLRNALDDVVDTDEQRRELRPQRRKLR